MAITEDNLRVKEWEADKQLAKVDPDLAREVASKDSRANELSVRRQERDELEELMADIAAGAEVEWVPVVVKGWRNRTVQVCAITMAERVKIRRAGFRQIEGPDGEPEQVETGELEPMLVQLSTYWDNSSGKRLRIFPKGTPEERALIKRQISGNLDEVVEVALRLSGLTKKAKEEAKKSFLESPTPGSDSDYPEISE